MNYVLIIEQHIVRILLYLLIHVLHESCFFTTHEHRRSPDRNSQDVSSEKYRSGSETPNGDQSQGVGQGSIPPSPTKTGNNCSRRSSTHGNLSTETTTPHNYETTFDVDGNVETASLTSSRDGNR